MARPFYPNEVDDPDLDWLISNFLSDRPEYVPVEAGLLPLILLPHKERVEEIRETKEPTIVSKNDKSKELAKKV